MKIQKDRLMFGVILIILYGLHPVLPQNGVSADSLWVVGTLLIATSMT